MKPIKENPTQHNSTGNLDKESQENSQSKGAHTFVTELSDLKVARYPGGKTLWRTLGDLHT